MNDSSRVHTNKLIWLLAILMASGCKWNEGICGVDRCADVPCGAIPAKPGTQLCQWQQAQVAAASTDLGVFYQADFIGTTSELGPAAREQVGRMTQQGLVGKVPVILDASEDQERDSKRTVALAAAFSEAGVPMSPEQIQVAYPPALGLSSVNAEQAARRLGRQGGGNGSGMMGGGFGGGGLGGLGGGGGFGGGFGGGGFF